MVKFAVSVITDEFSKDLNRVCEYLSSKTVEYVELRHALEGGILSIDDNVLGRVKDILQTHGLKVSCIAGGTLKWRPLCEHPLDSSEYQKLSVEYENEIFRGVFAAKFLEAPYIRCFGMGGKWQTPPFDQWSEWPIYQEWQKFIKLATEEAKAAQKMYVCENDAGFNKSLPQIEKIGKENAGPAFGMLFDFANVANKFGLDGILTDEWLPRISRYVQYIHAKGSRRFWRWQSTTHVNGKGDITRWPQVLDHFASMKDEDFVTPAPNPLFLSIETHMGPKNRWKNSAISLQNLLDLVETY